MTMFKQLIAPVLVLIAGYSSLQAQLVETTKAPPRKKAPAKASAPTSAAKGATSRVLDKKLSDFGITPRSLATWRTTGGSPSLSFFEISLRRIEKAAPDSFERAVDPKVLQADGLTLNGFQVQGADFLANEKSFRNLVLMRLNKLVPQASKDSGQNWVDGEKVGEAWIFAFPNETLTLWNADEAFTPREFKAWALERAAVIRTEKNARPFFHSAIVSVAYGKNELQGLVKFPGTTFVLAFRGIRYKDRWVARSLEMQTLDGQIDGTAGASNSNPGIGPLKNFERIFPQLEFDENRLQIGTGPAINYGQDGDSAEQLRNAVEFDLTKGRSLPEMAAAHKVNFTRSLWTKSDEDGSFSREAERAYVQAGLPVWFFAPRRETGFEQGGGRSMKPMLERIQRLGGKVKFIPLQ
jgi:hypothetical protein